MMKASLYFILALVLVALTTAQTEAVRFNGHKVYRLIITSEEQYKKLLQLEHDAKVDIWATNLQQHRVDVRVAPEYQHDFINFVERELRVTYEVYIEDIQVLIDAQIEEMKNIPKYVPGKEKSDDEFFDKFRTLEEVHAWLRNLEAKYPSIAKVFNAGKSYEGRDILGIKIEGNPGKAKPAIFYIGTIHAREWISTTTVNWIIYQLVSKYGTDKEVTKLVDYVSWHIIPVTNPDGFVYTHVSNRMWRKTRRPSSSLCVGVDANRNFAYKWNTGGSSSNPCSETYHGSKPFSEPEALAIAEYAKKIPNLSLFVDYHAYSQLFMRPWGYTRDPSPAEAEHKKLGDACANAITKTFGKTYQSGRVAVIIYQTSGGTLDWTYGELGAISYAVELRDTGRYGFIAPVSEIRPCGEENFNAVKLMGEFVIDKFFKKQ